MKTLRRFITAFLLILTLAGSLCAGVISTPIAPPNPTPSQTAEGASTTSVNGVISTPNAEAVTAGGSLTDAAVALIQGVLSLF
jgi:hypothetical protein